MRKAADLGLGVVVNPEDVIAYTEDDYNDLVRLKTKKGRISYRFHGSWEKEPEGAQNANEYLEMLSKVARKRVVVKVGDCFVQAPWQALFCWGGYEIELRRVCRKFGRRAATR